MLTAERLRELLTYDPESGNFVRRVSRRSAKAGTQAGGVDKDGYVQIRIDGRQYPAHRLAWLYITGEWPLFVDHEDRVRNNNKWCNLRVATKSQNAANCAPRRTNRSGLKGVSFHKKTSKWGASIRVAGKLHWIGIFDTPEEAHAAYLVSARQFFGEFARAA